MPEDDLPTLSPEQITGAVFPTKRKGYDPAAVDSHLRLVATSAREQRTANTRLRAELAEHAGMIAELKERLLAASNYDEETLLEHLGDTASTRLEEAQTEAEAIRAAARDEADELIAGAEAAHAEATAEATRNATDEADRLVHEAQIFRRQILEDLSRRRGEARRQIEQLRAGRERLIASHDIMRRALDGIGEELNISMAEARLAAETAGHGVAEDTVDDLEAEVETARLSGLLASEVAMIRDIEETVSDDEEAEDENEEAVDGDEDAADDADDPSALASVVALSSARADVQTGSHPSSGRDSTNRPQKPYDEEDEHDEDLVEDLFSRMRSTRATKDAGEDGPEEPAAEDLEAFIGELARQLKRVLAEEQTEILTILRSGDEVPNLDALVGSQDDHRRRYQEPAAAAADEIRTMWGNDASTGDLVIEANINELVETLRRGVSRSLAADDMETDAMVDDLGVIYREVKTERIVGHATTVCEAAADVGSRGNLSSV